MRKNDKGGEDTLLAKMYGSNPSIQGQIHRFKRLDGLGRGRNRDGEEEMRAALARETWLRVLNPCSAPEYIGAEIGAKICGAELGAKICGAELGAMCSGAEVPAT